MAENEEVDNKEVDNKDDVVVEEGDESTKKGLSKPLLIKIIIGVVVLLAAGGGYFFFMTGDDAASEDEVSEQVEGEEELDADELEEAELDKDEFDENGDIPLGLPGMPEELEQLEDDLESDSAMDDSDEILDEDMGVDTIELPDIAEDSAMGNASENADTSSESSESPASDEQGSQSLKDEVESLKQRLNELEKQQAKPGEVVDNKDPADPSVNFYLEPDKHEYPDETPIKSKWGEFETLKKK